MIFQIQIIRIDSGCLMWSFGQSPCIVLQCFCRLVGLSSNKLIFMKCLAGQHNLFLKWPQYFHEKQGSSRDYENLIRASIHRILMISANTSLTCLLFYFEKRDDVLPCKLVPLENWYLNTYGASCLPARPARHTSPRGGRRSGPPWGGRGGRRAGGLCRGRGTGAGRGCGEVSQFYE